MNDEQRRTIGSTKLFVIEAINADRRLGRAELKVMLALCLHLNGETKDTWVSQDVIAGVSCMSRPTVIKAIRKLSEYGWISRELQSGRYCYSINEVLAMDFIDLKDERKQIAQEALKERGRSGYQRRKAAQEDGKTCLTINGRQDGKDLNSGWSKNELEDGKACVDRNTYGELPTEHLQGSRLVKEVVRLGQTDRIYSPLCPGTDPTKIEDRHDVNAHRKASGGY